MRIFNFITATFKKSRYFANAIFLVILFYHCDFLAKNSQKTYQPKSRNEMSQNSQKLNLCLMQFLAYPTFPKYQKLHKAKTLSIKNSLIYVMNSLYKTVFIGISCGYSAQQCQSIFPYIRGKFYNCFLKYCDKVVQQVLQNRNIKIFHQRAIQLIVSFWEPMSWNAPCSRHQSGCKKMHKWFKLPYLLLK